MKANELMQGDLVMYEYDGEKTHARVVEIYRSSALVESVSKEYEPIEIEEDKLFPIAITPEILKKNGFDKYGDNFIYEKVRLYMQIKLGAFVRVFCGMDNTVSFAHDFYVHRFQNALRLCGIEKEITL